MALAVGASVGGLFAGIGLALGVLVIWLLAWVVFHLWNKQSLRTAAVQKARHEMAMRGVAQRLHSGLDSGNGGPFCKVAMTGEDADSFRQHYPDVAALADRWNDFVDRYDETRERVINRVATQGWLGVLKRVGRQLWSGSYFKRDEVIRSLPHKVQATLDVYGRSWVEMHNLREITAEGHGRRSHFAAMLAPAEVGPLAGSCSECRTKRVRASTRGTADPRERVPSSPCGEGSPGRTLGPGDREGEVGPP